MGTMDISHQNQATSSVPISFTNGTGLSIYREALLPAILNAKHEVILTTCFWALSGTLNELVITLRQLSTNAVQSGNKVNVFICFSSRSALQKFLHTSSPNGFVYPPETWTAKLGLPTQSEVPGLNIHVKSLFFRPFSVLHSKYLIVDRKKAFLPSCNVSWEDWYECCIGFEGPIVRELFEFWERIWQTSQSIPSNELEDIVVSIDVDRSNELSATLLPHPHNSSLRNALWFLPKSLAPSLPITSLNSALLRILSDAKQEIILLTPNLTAAPVFNAICAALCRGVDVNIITDRRMMVAEQLVTAGTTTEQVIEKLIQAYKGGLSGREILKGVKEHLQLVSLHAQSESTNAENRPLRFGKLTVSYFKRPVSQGDMNIESSLGKAAIADKSHIKLTFVDKTFMVLGSGNMDRASWITSQELGVLISDHATLQRSESYVQEIWAQVEKGLNGCLEHYFVHNRD